MLLVVTFMSALLCARFPKCTGMHIKWFCMHDISCKRNYNLWRPDPLWIFADFHWDLSENWIIYILCYNAVVLKKKKLAKLLKIAILWPYLGVTSMGHTQNQVFFLEITKIDYKLSRTFYFTKYKFWLSYDWFFVLCDILLPKRAISNWNSCPAAGLSNRNPVEPVH